MAITKLKCPTCQGPAIAVSERSIAGMRSVMYKCGHVCLVKQLARFADGLLLIVAHIAFSKLTISIATSAASAPLISIRANACSSFSVVRIAFATGMPYCS